MQQVVLGLMNDNDVIIHEGVSLEDQLYLSTPPDTAGIERVYLPEEILNKYKEEEEQGEIVEETPAQGNTGDISERQRRRPAN